MKRILGVLFLSAIIGACASSPQRNQDLVNRALDAMGGAEALAQIKTISVKGTWKQWEPEQSMVAGGEMRFANEATFETTADFTARAARVDWVKNFAYPTPRTFKYTEIVMPEAGYVLGIDSGSRNKQSMETNPPAHAMSGLRLAATQRELRRVSPMLLLEMRNNPDRLSGSPDIAIGGVTYPAVSYNAGAYAYVVMFDPQTGLPARIRTLDYDYVWGDVNYDLVLSDWRTMGGIKVSASPKYELNGAMVTDVRITDVVVNPAVPAGRFDPPASIKAGAARPAASNVNYQWALRRQFIGLYLDSDSTSFDARATSSLRLVEVAPGVQHQVGGTHHSMIVEMRDYLVVLDAPVSDWQSNWTIAAAQAKYPGKPIKYLVQSHHHMDHSGGIRAYAAQGATIVVGKGNGAHFRKILSAPYTGDPDLAARDLSAATIVEVADKYVISDGKREVVAYLAENPHVAGMLISYIPDARLGFVVDIWSPGVPLPDKINPGLAAVVSTMKKAGVQPARFAGGHGPGAADYAPLAALAGN